MRITGLYNQIIVQSFRPECPESIVSDQISFSITSNLKNMRTKNSFRNKLIIQQFRRRGRSRQEFRDTLISLALIVLMFLFILLK